MPRAALHGRGTGQIGVASGACLGLASKGWRGLGTNTSALAQ